MSTNSTGPEAASARGRSSTSPDELAIRVARAFQRRIEGRYSVQDVFVFGSRARGTHGAKSDLDLAVVLEGAGGERGRIAGEMAEIAFDLLLETDVLVQAIPLWEEELRNPSYFSNPRLIANVVSEGVRV